MLYDDLAPSRARRTLSAGGRTLRALGLDGPLTGVLGIIVCIGKNDEIAVANFPIE